MSFDIYFVERPDAERGWSEVMDQLEAASAEQRSPTDEEIELWDRLVAAVRPVVPEGEVFEDERSRVFDDGVGLQINMFPGEISINTPYWFDREQAEPVVQRLRAVARAIEGATGLVAYDPQAEAAFLDSGAESAVATFDKVHAFLETKLGTPEPEAERPSRWRFWRR